MMAKILLNPLYGRFALRHELQKFNLFYRNDPALAIYFDKTAKWADSISRQSNGTSANSEVLFMRKVNEDIRSIT
jgi:hypothetical protein